MANEFSVVRELSRREVDRHKKQFIGVTVGPPRFQDTNGLLEWVCDVRVESRGQYIFGFPWIPPGDWGIIKGVLLAQWTVGIIADMNVPVLIERSESGRLTIMGRAVLRLPDINVTSYTFDELDFLFMTGLTDLGTDGWVDGYGYPADDPVGATGQTSQAIWESGYRPLGDGFIWGVNPWGEIIADWVQQ